MSEKLPFDGLTEEERRKERLRRWNRRMRDLDNLKSEYLWHMKQRDDFLDVVITQGKHIDQLEAENAKLRELVNDMWICMAHGSEGWDCTGCRRDPDSVCIMGISEFSQRMRELGIEVE